MSTEHALSNFQADEVAGLLDTVADEIASGQRRTTWGVLVGTTLTVNDHDEAASDLHWRAESLRAAAMSNSSDARSLVLLADKVEVAGAKVSQR